MFTCRCSCHVPELLEPLVIFFLRNHAEFSLPLGRLPIAAGLPLHQYKFHIVLDDGIRLIRLSKELRAVAHLVIGIGDLGPYYRIEVIETDLPADNCNIRMQGKTTWRPKLLRDKQTSPTTQTKRPPGTKMRYISFQTLDSSLKNSS